MVNVNTLPCGAKAGWAGRLGWKAGLEGREKARLEGGLKAGLGGVRWEPLSATVLPHSPGKANKGTDWGSSGEGGLGQWSLVYMGMGRGW